MKTTLDVEYLNSKGGVTRLQTPGEMTWERAQEIIGRYKDDPKLLRISLTMETRNV